MRYSEFLSTDPSRIACDIQPWLLRLLLAEAVSRTFLILMVLRNPGRRWAGSPQAGSLTCSSQLVWVWRKTYDILYEAQPKKARC